MEYKNRIEFASRSIEIYRKSPKEYNFTAAVGVLLNILSSVCPDNDFLIDITVSNLSDIPGLENSDKDYVKDFLLNLRHGLAHKTEKNFKDYLKDDSISELQITSSKQIIARFNIDDLEKIIDFLDEKVQERLDLQ